MVSNPSSDSGSGNQPKDRPAKRLRILVVDDEPNVREVLRGQLEHDGHEVHTAADGKEGLQRFVGEKWDVVLTDRVMPGMSGDELAEAIKRITPTMPIILITAYTDRTPDPMRADSPFDMTVRKPFNHVTIRAAITAVCQS